jgi:DNA-binding NtrC family response regulator
VEPLEINAHILVIAQDTATYNSYAEELRARDWKVGVVGSFKEALAYIATDCPQVVLISYNHDDVELKNSPKILERRFGLQCLAFCERRAKNTAKLLLQSGLKNMLFPPITVDAIFDKVSRMLRDKAPRKKREEKNKAPVINRPLFEDDNARAANAGALFAAPPPVQHNYHDLSRA